MKKGMWIAILVIAALLVTAGLACANGETDVREPEEPTETETPTPTSTPTASPTATPDLAEYGDGGCPWDA